MEITVCNQVYDVDELHADLLNSLSKYAIRDTRKVYSPGNIYVPFERVIELLDLVDKDYQFKTS